MCLYTYLYTYICAQLYAPVKLMILVNLMKKKEDINENLRSNQSFQCYSLSILLTLK